MKENTKGEPPFTPATIINASLLSEMACHAASLGRGFTAPFKLPQVSYYVSCVSIDSMDALADAAIKFAGTHDEPRAKIAARIKKLKKGSNGEPMPEKDADGNVIDIVSKITGGAVQSTTPGEECPFKEVERLEEMLAKSPRVMWVSAKTCRNTLVLHMNEAQYGAHMLHDMTGERLNKALRSHLLIPAEMSHWALVERTKECARLKSEGKSNAKTIELGSAAPSLSYFNRVSRANATTLLNKLNKTGAASTGCGHSVVLTTREATPVYTDTHQLYQLFENVYRRGEAGNESARVTVYYSDESKAEWETFFCDWGIKELANREVEITEEDRQTCLDGPVSVENTLLVAARAAMTKAFLDRHKSGPGLELNSNDLSVAKQFARTLFEISSRYYLLEQKVNNRKKADATYVTEEKKSKAWKGMMSHIVEHGSFTDSDVANIPGLTARLVREFVEAHSVEKLTGSAAKVLRPRATNVYRLPLPPEVVHFGGEEADELLKTALEDHVEGTKHTTADFNHYISIQKKAEIVFDNPLCPTSMRLPCLPLTHLSAEEIEALPRILEDFSPDFLMSRGGTSGNPESDLDRDTTEEEWKRQSLDETVKGMNDEGFYQHCTMLWVRLKSDGKPFLNFYSRRKNNELEHWGKDDVIPKHEHGFSE